MACGFHHMAKNDHFSMNKMDNHKKNDTPANQCVRAIVFSGIQYRWIKRQAINQALFKLNDIAQEAVLFSKGQLMGKFGPGKHKLTTENLPILRNLYGIPFGGKNPFFAEVWFVNRTVTLNIDWKTTAMRYCDPGYCSPCSLC